MKIIKFNCPTTLAIILILNLFSQLSISADNNSSLTNVDLSGIYQMAKITAAHGDGGENIGIRGGVFLVGGDRFSNSIDVYKDTLVIGAPGEDSNASGINGDETDNSNRDSGAVYVFENINGQWQQQFYIKGSDLSPNAVFGHSVAIDGNRKQTY